MGATVEQTSRFGAESCGGWPQEERSGAAVW
jgi:hypothetical protein